MGKIIEDYRLWRWKILRRSSSVSLPVWRCSCVCLSLMFFYSSLKCTTWWDFNHTSRESTFFFFLLVSIIFSVQFYPMGLRCVTHFVQSLSCDSHCLPKLIMSFLVSLVLILLLFCTSMNVFWLLMLSSGRAWPFSVDSPHFWNPSCFHTAMCWQSWSLCLLREWCKAHLLVQADREKSSL